MTRACRDPKRAISAGIKRFYTAANGIPDMRLFKDGREADQVVGALPEPSLRAFLLKHCPSQADGLASTGMKKLESGDAAGARASFEAALVRDGDLPAAHLGLARVALGSGDHDALARHVEAIRMGSDEYGKGQEILAASELVREATSAGDRKTLEARIASDPADLQALYGLGGHHLAAGAHVEALDRFLAIAQREPHWHGDAARKAMLVVFALLGARHPTSDEYREKLRHLYR